MLCGLFVDHKGEELQSLLETDFSLSSFKKNSDVKNPFFIELDNLEVVQVEETDDLFGYTYTGVLTQDYDVLPYRLNYIGKSKKLSEGKSFSAIVLPLGYSTYETVNGGKDWAFTGWIMSVE